MSIYLQTFITFFLGFFAIINPIANTPVFVALVGNQSKKERAKTALRALFISFCIIVAFALLGKAIFTVFGITLTALKITGGVLVFLIGFQMLHGTGSSLHQDTDDDSVTTANNSDIAISPLAMPLLAGPGTIAAAMNYAATGGWVNIALTIGAVGVVCIITYVCFISGPKIIAFIGENGFKIITRLMGLILAVIGTQMLIEGIYGAVRAFS